ncbi:SRPBCC family protein [Vibrio superstes]|uniref:Uncharacterized protein n=1 Tax=Vibrio superstes NBRC 103154 TaxID=1219062 RepID=A0A511QNJ5_9VIBR|nr:SRPBCC family protein [Vibrio superstes]GEM78903.1 hypothetical protein VSU01S_11480 [Vibrio superstes NBRC 103154]
MSRIKTYSFELSHHYKNITPEEFWAFFLDLDWYSESEIMQGEMTLVSEGDGALQGIGAIRKLKIDKIQLTEKVVGFELHRYFSYQVLLGGNGMPMDNYRGEFFFTPREDGTP